MQVGSSSTIAFRLAKREDGDAGWLFYAPISEVCPDEVLRLENVGPAWGPERWECHGPLVDWMAARDISCYRMMIVVPNLIVRIADEHLAVEFRMMWS